MLEATRPFGAPVRPFCSALVTVELAREPWHFAGYWALRSQIFCRETRLFAAPEQERDAHDRQALAFVALAHSAGTPDTVVGVVRAYRSEGSTWYGGRLGVSPRYRARPQIGSALIAAAVGAAVERGCERFLAIVLAHNAAYFARHRFAPQHALEHCGRPHLLMQAELAAFVPAAERERAA
jgi:putative N-acetyltransferase (TIGR04045 family)